MKMSIGRKLKELRKERKLTQQVVADCLNISRSVYSQYENDEREPSIKRLLSICRFYMTTLDFICSNDDRLIIDITDLSDTEKAKIYAIIRENEINHLQKI